MKKATILLVALALALGTIPALATTQTISLPAGSTESGGNPVSATAVFTISDGQIIVDLWNTQPNISTVAQNISDLFFTLSTGQTSGTLSSSGGGVERTVAAGGSFSDAAYDYTGSNDTLWKLDSDFVYGALTGLHLNGLGVQIPGATPPNSNAAHTIIGLPSYSDGSIGGNAPHNPFLFGTESDPIEFVLAVSGVTEAATRVDFVSFSFGTTAGNNVNVPIPPSVLLLGSGFLGIGILRFSKSC